jgi:DNA (cytosine-5)-methyltransferase 1
MLVPEIANPLTARMHKGINSTCDEGQTMVAMPFDTTQITHPENRSNPKHGDPCHALASGAHVPAIAFKPGSSAQARSIGAEVEVCPSLEAGGGGNNRPAIAFAEVADPIAANQAKTWTREGCTFRMSNVAIAPALTASNDPSRSPQSSEVTQQVAAVHSATMQVRRLTPVECERLQGFPDNYTAIPYRGKPADKCPDGPRYKALGNSMAVPVMAWIGRRITAAEAREAAG